MKCQGSNEAEPGVRAAGGLGLGVEGKQQEGAEGGTDKDHPAPQGAALGGRQVLEQGVGKYGLFIHG